MYVLLIFQFDNFAASSFQMSHQIYACFGSLLFFFEILLKAYLFDTFVILNNKWIPISMIFCVLAREIIIAKKTAFKLLFGRAFSVFARCASTIQTHRALCVRKPLQTFSELFKAERFDYRADPVITNSVYESFQLPRNHLHSSIPIRALTTVDATYSVLIVFSFHFKSPL